MNQIVVIAPMTYSEARLCCDRIKGHMNDMRKLVLDLYERQGWKKLGYNSFKDCVSAEFSQSWQHVYRLKDAALVERRLLRAENSPLGDSPALPERHARELGKLDDPNDMVEAYRNAIELARTEGKGKPTTEHIEQSVALIRARKVVFRSPYVVVGRALTKGEVLPSEAVKMVEYLDEIKRPHIRGFVILMIAKHGVSCAELLPELASMKDRKPGKESKVLAEIEATGCVDGTPLATATLSDLSRARAFARREHIEDAQHKLMEEKGVVAKIITVYEGDVGRTLKSLQEALPDGELRRLMLHYEMGRWKGYFGVVQ